MLMKSGRKGSVTMAVLAAAVGALVVTGNSQPAFGQVVSSEEGAGYILFPKIIVHTSAGNPAATTVQQDTLLQLTNTNTTQSAALHCYYVNSNGHCSNDDNRICYSNLDCVAGGVCNPGWSVINFDVLLTPEQPLGWSASAGLDLPCEGIQDPMNPGQLVPPRVECRGINEGRIPGVIEDPFRGELKCIQVTSLTDDTPVGRNDVIGTATLYRAELVGGGGISTASYNAIGFQTDTSPGTSSTDPICLGSLSGVSCAKTYAGCPGVLILQHLFEDPGDVGTELTLVPCTEDLRTSDLGAQVSTAVQMLIYNEYEQRFSTARRVQCYANLRLADIDTQPGTSDDAFSIFSQSVQGTIAGQTRLRPIEGSETTVGHGLVGVAEEIHFIEGSTVDESAAYHLNYTGDRTQGDAVYR